MRKILRLTTALLLFPLAGTVFFSELSGENEKNMYANTIFLRVGNAVFTADLEENSSARALKEMLAEGDVTIVTEDYAGMEKVGPLGRTLPRNDTRIRTRAGDLILYQGRYFVIYYGENEWILTRLGKIRGASRERLLAALGSGDAVVTLSLK